MKVLVTGANGYLGQGIVKALLDKNISVVATDITVDHIDERAIHVCCDLFSLEDPYRYFGEPDVVLHLAWRDGFVHNSDSHLNYLPMHCNLIKRFIDNGLKHLAVMGSMHEVGFFQGSIDENTPCNPQSCYGIAKNALRQYVSHLASTNDFIFQWLRGYYIVGNSEYGSSIFSKIAAAAKNEKKSFPFTTGQNQFDFIDYDSFCLQVACAITQSEINGIINICSGHPEKLADRVERFIRENAYSIKLQYGTFPDRPYDSKAVWGDNQKIKMILENAINLTH